MKLGKSVCNSEFGPTLRIQWSKLQSNKINTKMNETKSSVSFEFYQTHQAQKSKMWKSF